MQKKHLLIALAAVLGLGGAQTTVAKMAVEQREQLAVKNGATKREIEEDIFGDFNLGLLKGLMREGGNSPKDWGMSRACQKMRRKNAMVAKGIGRARI